MKQNGLLLLLIAYAYISAEGTRSMHTMYSANAFVADDSCHHRDYYNPCDFSLIVPKREWREGSRVTGINCTSVCTKTEPGGVHYTLEMLLDDEPIKRNDSRFELDCFEGIPTNDRSAAVLSVCFLAVEVVSRNDDGHLACNLHRGGTRLGGKHCTIKVLCKLVRRTLPLWMTNFYAQQSLCRRI